MYIIRNVYGKAETIINEKQLFRCENLDKSVININKGYTTRLSLRYGHHTNNY